MALYEIRRDGITLAQPTLPGLGYPPELLRQMERAGYTVCIDGKPRKKRETQTSENP